LKGEFGQMFVKKFFLILFIILIALKVYANFAVANSDNIRGEITITIETDEAGAERLHNFLVRNGYVMPFQRTYFQTNGVVTGASFDVLPYVLNFLLILLILGLGVIAFKFARRIVRIIKESREEKDFFDNVSYLNHQNYAQKGRPEMINLSERLGGRHYA